MKTTTGRYVGTLGTIVLTLGVATSIEAWPRQAVPHSGGGGPRATAPHHGGSAPRAPLSPGGTARGVARYGHHYGGSVIIGFPWWGLGWYDGWWGWPGYGYAAYGPWYGPGYAPYDGAYIASLEAQRPGVPATIETGISPSKAEVVLDGESVGFASDYNGRWDELSVAPGPHTIAFQANGYRTLVVAFTAHPGSNYAFHDALVAGDGEDHRNLTEAEPAPPQKERSPIPAPVATGRLRIHAEPADSALYLDGEYLGLAADLGRIHGSLAVSTGTHRLEAVRPGYVSGMRTIEVGEAEPATVELTLEPER